MTKRITKAMMQRRLDILNDVSGMTAILITATKKST